MEWKLNCIQFILLAKSKSTKTILMLYTKILKISIIHCMVIYFYYYFGVWPHINEPVWNLINLKGQFKPTRNHLQVEMDEIIPVVASPNEQTQSSNCLKWRFLGWHVTDHQVSIETKIESDLNKHNYFLLSKRAMVKFNQRRALQMEFSAVNCIITTKRSLSLK